MLKVVNLTIRAVKTADAMVDTGAAATSEVKMELDRICKEITSRVYLYVEANEYVLRRYVPLAWNNRIRYTGPPWNEDETLAFCARAESGNATLAEMVEHLQHCHDVLEALCKMQAFVLMKYGGDHDGPVVSSEETRAIIERAKEVDASRTS